MGEGTRWVTLTLANRGASPLQGLDVELSSLDVYSIDVLTKGAYVPVLDPAGKEVIPIQVSAQLSGSVYVTVDGEREGDPFHWESPDMTLRVGEESAELVSLLALAKAGSEGEQLIRCEATLRGRLESEGLTLQFWAETPGGEFRELANVETKTLSPGEEARHVIEVEVDDEGLYSVYGYLYDGTRRLGRNIERIQVE